MITEVSNKSELLAEIDETVSELVSLFSSLDDDKINSIPYKDSWTAGQLLRHVAKSTTGMAKAMQMQSKTVERDPGKRINELKTTFLDFANKMQSPDMIVPEEQSYDKQSGIKELSECLGQFKENTNKVNLNDLVEGLPLGEITKLEMLHFVLYHTQRHLHQMKKIYDALKSKE